MKKIKLLAITAFAILGLASCSNKSSNDLLSEVQNKGEITVATEGTWAPWTYHDEKDNLVGFDVDVARLLAKKMGLNAKMVEVEWDGIFAGIDSKRYDMTLNGVEITDERSEKYDFSEPYGYIKTAIIVRGDNDSIHSFEDLNGKQTANTLASTYALLAEQYGATAVGVDDLVQTLELVLAGRVDATLNADVSYYDYMKAHPEANLKIVALTDSASSVAIPVRKGEETKTLLTALNKAIEEMRESGELSEISIKYFGSDITSKE